MNQDTIYVMSEDNELEAIAERGFQSEDLLQRLIADHPDLLSGSQIDPDDPPRWLLVTREAGIPDHAGGGDRWSMDHLLLDQHGRPTFVEVKRSSDTRIRREVVGQMLDYAANAQAYWPEGRIQALASDRCGGVKKLQARLAKFLGHGDDAEAAEVTGYWDTVEEHLRNGEVRLLFVADRIPTELRRTIEFLNNQMPAVEVLGVEVHQYKGAHVTALVPRVVGQTEYARQQKARVSTTSRNITQRDFLDRCTEPQGKLFTGLFHLAESSGYTLAWGTKACSFRTPNASGSLQTVFYAFPAYAPSDTAVFQVYLGYFDDHAVSEDLRRRCTALAPFTPNGEQTIGLTLDTDGVAQLTKIAPELFALLRQAASGNGVPGTGH